MAETNPPNPESSRPEDQEHADPGNEPQGAAASGDDLEAQNLRDAEGDDSANAADAESSESAEQMAEEALQAAEHATEQIKAQAGAEDVPTASEPDEASTDAATASGDTPGTDKFDLPDFTSGSGGTNGQSAHPSELHLLDDIDLEVTVELGRTEMYVEDVLKLNENSVVELDKAAGDPVDIYVNNRHIARGEVLVLNENFCVRISEIINHNEEL